MSITYTLSLYQGTFLDTGANTAITVRPEVFPDGMPATTTADYAVATATAHRPDVANNPLLETSADVPLDAY